MTPVKSSNVAAVGYDPLNAILSVKFKSGKKIYHYHGVPAALHSNLHKSESIGKYISSMLVGKFKHTTEDIK